MECIDRLGRTSWTHNFLILSHMIGGKSNYSFICPSDEPQVQAAEEGLLYSIFCISTSKFAQFCTVIVARRRNGSGLRRSTVRRLVETDIDARSSRLTKRAVARGKGSPTSCAVEGNE